MFKSSARLIFFLVPVLLFAASCSIWRASETVANQPHYAPGEASSEIPFSTKEPLIYQAEIVVQTFNDGEKIERRIFIARSGSRRLTVFNSGAKNETAQLNLDSGSILLLYPRKKIFTERPLGASPYSADSANDFLTTEWLNQKTASTFENLGDESGLSRFRVKLSENENAGSEILIYIDKNINLPVRQEFYSASGEQKTLTFIVELENFKTEADEKFFEISKDFRKIPLGEFQEILWKERTANE